MADYPCDTCGNEKYCDGWEVQFCCTLCNFNYDGDIKK